MSQSAMDAEVPKEEEAEIKSTRSVEDICKSFLYALDAHIENCQAAKAFLAQITEPVLYLVQCVYGEYMHFMGVYSTFAKAAAAREAYAKAKFEAERLYIVAMHMDVIHVKQILVLDEPITAKMPMIVLH